MEILKFCVSRVGKRSYEVHKLEILCVCVCVCVHAPEDLYCVCVGLRGGGGGFPLMEKQHHRERSEYLGLPCQPYGLQIYYVIHSKVKRPITQPLSL